MRDSQVEPSATGAFAGGVVSTVAVLLLFGAFLGLRLGTPRLLSRIRDTVLAATGPKAQRVLDLPADVRDELIRIGAVIDNAALARFLGDHARVRYRFATDEGAARSELPYSRKRSAVGEPAAFSSSSITLPNGSRP